MSDTQETDSPPRLVRLFCHGRCVKRGTCKGEVRRVTVKSGDGRHTWGKYNYCEAAISEDERNGYLVLPNNVIPKTMSDTPETQCGTTHYAGCACHEKDWQNKWQCAVELAAQAEAKLDALVAHHTRSIIAHAKEVDALKAEFASKTPQP